MRRRFRIGTGLRGRFSGGVTRFAFRRTGLPLAVIVGAVVASVAGASAAAPSYRDEVLADSPAGYWRLAETSGTAAYDETTAGNRGAYLGGATLGVGGALATDTNPAVRLDGGNDLVGMGDPASGSLEVGTGDFTAEAWLKTTTAQESSVVSKREAAKFWQVTITDDPNHVGQVRANVNDGTVTRQAYSTRRVDDGAWHHVVVRFDRDTGISFYIDGTAAGLTAGAMTGDLSNAGPFQIGKASGYAHFKGDIDEVAVYRQLLPKERIEAHFYASRVDTTPPVVTLDTPAAGVTTTDTTPIFSGTAGSALGDSTSLTIDVYSGAEATGTPLQTLTTTRAPDGTYGVSPTTPLASGVEYTARAEQADGFGNVGQSATTTFSVDDGTPPPGSVAMAGAGDYGWCDNEVDEQTAQILESMPYARVFTLGDNAYANGSHAEFANCTDPSWGRVKDRTYPSVGGHEYHTPGAAGYFDYYGAAAGDPTKGYYSYDYGSWHVVVLNSECNQIGGCGPGSPQENWLRRDLAAHMTDCTLAYWHVPLYSSGTTHGPDANMRPFWRALYDYGADLVVNAHEHNYERFLPQSPDGALDLAYGITQITAGTGGYLLYPLGPAAPNSAVRIDNTPGILKLVLHPDRFDWKFIGIPGTTATDSGTTSCHGPAAPPPPPPDEPPPPGQTGPYPGAVTSDSPRGYWRLGEVSGTAAANETGGAAGTYLSGVTLGRLGALDGDGDTAAGLDGGDDRISMGDPADGSLDFGTGDFTAEAWVKATANDERAIISKRPVSATSYWQVTVTDDGSQIGRVRVSISDGTVTRHVYGPAIRVDDGAWHHIVVVFDRDTGITIYVDGTAKANAGAVPGDLSNAGDLLVGKVTGYPNFKGTLDEVAVYATALSPERVQAHYDAGRGSG
jgi:hypothetical protein